MEGNLQRRLDEQRERSAAKRAPEVNAVIAETIQALREAGTAAGAPSPGDRAPGFSLPNVQGAAVSLGDLLGRGPAVLAFYRGVW